MAPQDDRRRPAALNLSPSRSSSAGSSSTDSSLKQPRTPRFAEATTVYSPIEEGNMPFSERSQVAQAQPADVGFGYINDSNQNAQSVNMPMTPKSPLKSALRVPGTPGRRFDNPLSPTFREEEILEKREKDTDKEQAKDLVSLSQDGQYEVEPDMANTRYRVSKSGYGWPSSHCAASASAAP